MTREAVPEMGQTILIRQAGLCGPPALHPPSGLVPSCRGAPRARRDHSPAFPGEAGLPIVLLAGPTGVGKTAFAVRLARLLETEIINADSMQVYRFMDIGTAKPGAVERSLVRHHLLDVVNPDEPFDAARYLDLAAPIIASLHGSGKIPVVVGGTGLYMKVLTRGICPAVPGDPAIREQLLCEEREKGLAALHAELLAVDPPSGRRIHPNDRQRVLRALEVFRHTGETLSGSQDRHRFARTLFRAVKIFLVRSREDVYQRIERRVEAMIAQGFVKEVAGLLEMGYGPDLRPMLSLGYKQIAAHLRGETSLDEAVCRIKRETRRYAKRQMTWFRADPEFQWFDASDEESILPRIRAELAKHKG